VVYADADKHQLAYCYSHADRHPDADGDEHQHAYCHSHADRYADAVCGLPAADHKAGDSIAFNIGRLQRFTCARSKVQPNTACTRLAPRAADSGDSCPPRFGSATESSQTRASG
jgi:hypothetical protein